MLMQIKSECSSCKSEFTVGEEGAEVLQRDVQNRDDEAIVTITYFRCPVCDVEHVVQLDDEYSKDLLEQITAMLKSKIMFSRMGKKVTKKMKREFRQKRMLLREHRNGLMAKYNNTIFIEENGAEFELHCELSLMNEEGDENGEE